MKRQCIIDVFFFTYLLIRLFCLFLKCYKMLFDPGQYNSQQLHFFSHSSQYTLYIKEDLHHPRLHRVVVRDGRMGKLLEQI
jgi:hypothetical protein